jgi:hypothetical protein
MTAATESRQATIATRGSRPYSNSTATAPTATRAHTATRRSISTLAVTRESLPARFPAIHARTASPPKPVGSTFVKNRPIQL